VLRQDESFVQEVLGRVCNARFLCYQLFNELSLLCHMPKGSPSISIFFGGGRGSEVHGLQSGSVTGKN